jgi:hypothetical protein
MIGIQMSKNSSIVSWDLQNRWHNYFVRNIMLFSHTFRKWTVCPYILASLGHASTRLRWWNSLPPALSDIFLGIDVVFQIFISLKKKIHCLLLFSFFFYIFFEFWVRFGPAIYNYLFFIFYTLRWALDI